MTDLSVTHPHAYALMTAACWAVPVLALAWGAFRLRRALRCPCDARCGLLGPTVWKTYRCTRPRRHLGHHRSASFEWVDDEIVIKQGKDPSPSA